MTTNNLPNNQPTFKVCSIEDCEEKHYAKTFCYVHWKRNNLHGNPLIVKRNNGSGKNRAERFWSRVAITADDQRCWEWTGCKGTRNYGMIKYEGKKTRSHKVAWYLTYGKYPDLLLLHSCDNPSCVNPNHLREGTNADNTQDKVSRNRQAKGEKSGTAKLNTSSVRQIRQLLRDGVRMTAIAKQFDVAPPTIRQIKLGRTWSHVK